jgi:hypothetical protein
MRAAPLAKQSIKSISEISMRFFKHFSLKKRMDIEHLFFDPIKPQLNLNRSCCVVPL